MQHRPANISFSPVDLVVIKKGLEEAAVLYKNRMDLNSSMKHIWSIRLIETNRILKLLESR